MDRKIVKPAQERGRIWNPEHNGFVPAGGIEVQMAPYWIGLEQRGDIVSSEVQEAEATPPAPSPVAPGKASAPAAPKA